MLTTSIIITSIAQILLVLFVYQKDRRNLTNVLFACLSVATLCWALTNYLTIFQLDSENLISVVRLILFCVVIQNAFFYLFARTFPGASWKHSRKGLYMYGIFTFAAALATLSPFVFTSVKVDNGLPVTEAGPAILIFVAHAAFSIIVAFRSLIKKLRSASGTLKNQLQILLIASVLNWIVVPITNFALTPLLQTTTFIRLSPIYTFAFAAIIGYAIISQKLFDIRLIVARAVAYFMLISTLIGTYVAVVFGLTSVLAQNESELVRQSLPLFAALFLVLTAPLFKRLFDHLTNKIFYHDAYDPQTFLDQLNKTLVGNIEIGILMRHTAMVIGENIKAECHIFVKDTETASARLLGTSQKYLKEENLELIKSELATIKQKTVVADGLEPHYHDLKSALEASDIAVISSLITSYAANQEATAYLMLGPKKSGNAYSKQDIRIVNIITDELLIAIQNALRFEEIQSFNITLQKRINDATAKLKRSNEKLKEMDETKDEFISMASHQLRTPLTSVKGYLSMVLDGDAGKVPKGQEELLNQAYVSAQRMVYLIADLLNVSRLKTGKFVIDATPTNLADMVESEIAQLTEVARGHKLTLTYSKPKDFPVLKLDETKTRQVVMNFIDNAIYYTPSGGKIKIELKTDRSSVYFMVKDNGLGVPKVDQGHLFTKFYRAKNAQKARPDGTGLGLFMAKKVITEQNGTILFESTEGKGSTFGFKFDKPKAPVT
jgi:signal transduction histidine kinase